MKIGRAMAVVAAVFGFATLAFAVAISVSTAGHWSGATNLTSGTTAKLPACHVCIYSDRTSTHASRTGTLLVLTQPVLPRTGNLSYSPLQRISFSGTLTTNEGAPVSGVQITIGTVQVLVVSRGVGLVELAGNASSDIKGNWCVPVTLSAIPGMVTYFVQFPGTAQFTKSNLVQVPIDINPASATLNATSLC